MFSITSSLILSALNGSVCMLGDYMVEINQNSQLLKAICDNVTHATVGLLSVLIVILEANHAVKGIERLWLIVIGVLVSSFIDLDHFVVARSVKLSNAVSIGRRPFLHFTTIPLILMALAIPLQYFYRSSRLHLWLSIIICAFIAHHTRDATRRGFTLWPFGTTKPLPYPIYILCVMIIPFLLAKWHNVNSGRYNRTYGPDMQTV